MDELAAGKLRTHQLRALPQVQRLLEQPGAERLLAAHPRAAVVAALRAVLEAVRGELGTGGGVPDGETLILRAGQALAAGRPAGLRPVINATGILLHTNLGRAPLAEAAVQAAAEAARGYVTLEFDLASGERGTRGAGLDSLLREVTGAEAGLAVNNNAAAMLLAMSALAGAGGEVVVSRGELVEIGGGFRIPDVIRQGGARLVEIGTTNKTRLADYRDAITPMTRVLLKVHRSNFRMTGFTEAACLPELAALARAEKLVLVEDLGSGALLDPALLGRAPEATVQASLAAGADVVAFSGDKLLGGPQAGILAGRAAAIDRLRRHPLLRAVRLDKLSLAALEATLRLYAGNPAETVPVLRALAQTPALLEARAARLTALIGGAGAVIATTGFAGGGTMPGDGIPSFAVRLTAAGMSADRLAANLRTGHPAVVARIAAGAVLLDMLAVPDAALEPLAAAVRTARAA